MHAEGCAAAASLSRRCWGGGTCAEGQCTPAVAAGALCRAREHHIDGMCTMAAALEGCFCDVMMRVHSAGHLLVSELSEVLCQADEVAWIQACPRALEKLDSGFRV